MNTSQVGKEAECRAARFLESRGYRIVGRREKCGRFEIDLIARKGLLLVFAEVKWRSRSAFEEAPLYAVSALKQGKIRSAAAGLLDYYGGEEFRFDVLLGSPNGWQHLEGAFE